ncbi:MAG: hypothetical protein MZW92_64765 [Comamonadaceae bacterium]|nr:hypothetical protein [Comamonadaceae bacterium]
MAMAGRRCGDGARLRHRLGRRIELRRHARRPAAGGGQGDRVPGPHAQVRARSGAGTGRQHLHRRHARQPDRALRPEARTFREWDLPDGARPHGLVVDAEGIVWYTGNGNGSIGRLDPKSGKVTEYRAPSGGDPHTVVMDGKGDLWSRCAGRRPRRAPGAGDRSDHRVPDLGQSLWHRHRPPGLRVVLPHGEDKLGRIDPASGEMSELDTGSGSRPRRMATAPDGMLWVTAYGNGKLIKVDPQARRIVKSYPMPAGARRRALRRDRGRRGTRLGQRDRHRYRGAVRCRQRDFSRHQTTLEERRHPQGRHGRAGSLLVYGFPQRTSGDDRMKKIKKNGWHGLAVLLCMLAATAAWADEAPGTQLKQGGYVVLIRHAGTEFGIGDPPGFKLDDCSTQRNLSDGRKSRGAAAGRGVSAAEGVAGVRGALQPVVPLHGDGAARLRPRRTLAGAQFAVRRSRPGDRRSGDAVLELASKLRPPREPGAGHPQCTTSRRWSACQSRHRRRSSSPRPRQRRTRAGGARFPTVNPSYPAGGIA